MNRAAILAGVLWLLAAGAFAVVAAMEPSPQAAAAYLCGWLVLVSLPLGALPMLMVLEAIGAGDTAVAAALRLLLASLPVLALLFVPVLLSGGAYAWQSCHAAACAPFHYEGFGRTWFTHDLFALRSVIYLAVWFALSLYFLRPARPDPHRQALALFGLALHMVIGTLAAFDWFMSLDDGHVSTNYGILVIAAQCAFALTTALLLSLLAEPGQPGRRALLILVTLIGVASFAQFIEYLVVWSANLPKEIVWYQQRAPGGVVFAVVAPVVLGLAALALAAERASANRLICGCALAAFLAVEFVDLLLLGSPHGLSASGLLADGLALLTIGGLATACAFVFAGRSRRRPAQARQSQESPAHG